MGIQTKGLLLSLLVFSQKNKNPTSRNNFIHEKWNVAEEEWTEPQSENNAYKYNDGFF